MTLFGFPGYYFITKGFNDDLKKKNKWEFPWKMILIRIRTDSESYFFQEANKPNYLSLSFKNTVVIQLTNHNHLQIILDTKLDFQEQNITKC